MLLWVYLWLTISTISTHGDMQATCRVDRLGAKTDGRCHSLKLYTSMTACASLKSTPAPLAALLVCTGPAPRHISRPQMFIWGGQRTKLGLFWCSFAVVWARKSHSRAGKTWIRIRKSGVKLVGRRPSPCHRRTGLSAEVRRADWRGGGEETEEREQQYETFNVFRHWCRGRSRQTPPSTRRSEVGVASIRTKERRHIFFD